MKKPTTRPTVDGESGGIGIGVTDHQLRNKGRKAGGEEHTVGVVAQAFLADEAIEHDTGGGGEHIQRMDAPSTETGGEQGHQGGGVMGLMTREPVKGGANQAHQAHIEEGGGITAHIEIVGAAQGGTVQNFVVAPEHIGSVGHAKCADQEAAAEK